MVFPLPDVVLFPRARLGLHVFELRYRTLVRDALSRTRGNQTRAAEALGLSRFGLQKRMKRLGIDP